ncbi:MAG TPA: hypothetical protein DGG95_03900 [Cytophagales bacterium]|jgi:hypothetical protein|nr:hypothetical protein [Cytophagales bacterium]
MKLIERIILLVFFLAILLKAGLFRGTRASLEISTLLLSMLYFYFGFALFNGIGFRAMFKKSSYAGVSVGKISGAIALGLALSSVLIGILFKLMFWPGANEMIMIGGTGLLIILLVASVVMVIKKKSLDSFYKGIFLRGSVALIFALVFFFTSQKSLIRFFHRDNPTFAELMIKAMGNPQDEELQRQLEEAGEMENK